MKDHLFFKDYEVFLMQSAKEGVILYAPLLRKLMRITDELAEDVSNLGFSAVRQHKRVDMLSDILSKSLSNSITPQDPDPDKGFHLSLELTRDCTLRCTYCHADAGKNMKMSTETLDAAIRHSFETCKEKGIGKLNISYVTGGEPTFKWDLFKESVTKIKESGERYDIKTNFSITTNGFYGEEKRIFLSDHFNSILLSIDGPEYIQNVQRPTRTGEDSFELVMESARYFTEHAKSFAVRPTITSGSVEYLPEIVRYFAEELGPGSHIMFEPCSPIGNADLSMAPSQEKYVEMYIKAKELGKTLGVVVGTAAEGTLDRLITSYCGSLSLPACVVTTEGFITGCEGDAGGKQYRYGKLTANGAVLDDNYRDRIRELSSVPESCSSCFAKYHCAGDCPTTRLAGHNNCVIIKSLVFYNLEEKLSSG